MAHAPGIRARRAARPLVLLAALVAAPACARSPMATAPAPSMSTAAPTPDPRIGLRAGKWDAAQAIWNMRLVSATRPAPEFVDGINSDLAFKGPYVIQGSFNGFQIWDITNPAAPALRRGFVCPASQSDVSVYRNLLFVSGEGLEGRLDCRPGGIPDSVSNQRLLGLRIFDITDVTNPRYIGNVQTCRGSHTHSVLVDPRDTANVYVYISGSAPVRSPRELPGCVNASPTQDPNSALFRIEVIRVPLANPAAAAIVSSPRIFNDLVAPPSHGESPDVVAEAARRAAEARARGAYTAVVNGAEMILPTGFIRMQLDSLVRARGGSGAPTAADSATLRTNIQLIVDRVVGVAPTGAPRPGPTQCHDITVYPALGLGGGACEGYGLLLDIRNPAQPVRIAAASDSNFAYWHSATFNNDGTKVLFTDEWGGGTQAKCRAADRPEWGANAIFTIEPGNRLRFHSYYKLPAAQTASENCVAHNGSLIPVPGRDIMVQSWYQGGISVFDWTDPARPREIAYFDRGPIDSTRLGLGGTWSAYWYNGLIVSSEIVRGLDILELTPSGWLSQNEIDAAKSVRMDYFNPQGQARVTWPPSFAVARAYVDQLERSSGLAGSRIREIRNALADAERASGDQRRGALTTLATRLDADAAGSSDAAKVRMLAGAVRELSR